MKDVEIKARALELSKRGLSVKDIAARLNVSLGRLQKILGVNLGWF